MRKLGQHQVDQLFERRLADAEMPVSDRMWAGIESELEKDRLRKAVFWYRGVAAAAVLLLVGTGAYMLSVLGGNNASMLAGKGLRPLEPGIAWHCPSAPAGSLPLQIASAPERQPQGYDRIVRTDVAAVIPANAASNLQTAIANAPKQLMAVREAMVARQPSIGNEGLGAARRATQPQPLSAIQRPDATGPFANLLPERKPNKRKEREFAFSTEDATPDADKARYWQIGAGFAPDMAFASTTPVQQDARSAQIIADDPLNANTNRLSPVVAYATGVRAAYAVNDRISVRTGVNYVNRETSTSETVNAFGKTATYQSALDLSSLEVPVSVRYNVLRNEHIDYFVAAGVSGSFLLSYKNYQVAPDGRIAAQRNSSADEVLTPSMGSMLLSTGVSYRLLDRVNLHVEPGMRVGVLQNKYAFSQSLPVSVNLSTGLNFQF